MKLVNLKYFQVETSRGVCRELKIPSLNYPQTVEKVFERGPHKLRKYTNTARTIMDLAMFFGALSGCVYFVFIASTIHEIFNYFFEINWSIRTYIAIMIVPVLLIAQIRDLKHLAPISAIANALLLGAFFITLYFIFDGQLEFSDKPIIVTYMKWPSAISTIIFSISNIRNAMSIENEMRSPQRYLGGFGVLYVASYIIAIFYTAVGFFSYLRYGNSIQSSVTLNIPVDDTLALVAKFFIGFAVLLSFGLIFNICMEILWPRILTRIKPENVNICQISIRCTLTFGMALPAILIPNLGVFISLLGTIFFGSLSILIPVIVETIYRYPRNYGLYSWRLYMNGFLIGIFIIVMVQGVYDDVVNIMALYQ